MNNSCIQRSHLNYTPEFNLLPNAPLKTSHKVEMKRASRTGLGTVVVVFPASSCLLHGACTFQMGSEHGRFNKISTWLKNFMMALILHQEKNMFSCVFFSILELSLRPLNYELLKVPCLGILPIRSVRWKSLTGSQEAWILALALPLTGIHSHVWV